MVFTIDIHPRLQELENERNSSALWTISVKFKPS